MTDLVLAAQSLQSSLDDVPVMVEAAGICVVLTTDGEIRGLDGTETAHAVAQTTPLLVNKVQLSRRLGVRIGRSLDLLELFAFVRPAHFCLPTLEGLACALRIETNIPDDPADQCLFIRQLGNKILSDIRADTYGYGDGMADTLDMMGRAGWPWAPYIYQTLSDKQQNSRDSLGLSPWRALAEWEDEGPLSPPDDCPVPAAKAENRLKQLIGDNAEDRPAQYRYTHAATFAFTPREMAGSPNLQLLEAGTGTGKTLAYVAPASLWAEQNGGPVWISTFTKNLQRQLDQELSHLYPNPSEKKQKVAIRKGRENYLCLLNFEETLRSVMVRTAAKGAEEDRDRVLMGLVARWLLNTRDGDMIGGDFPGWLMTHFGSRRVAGLTDRRGECLYSGCDHYRKCFVEKSVRSARRADLIVANHALLMANAALREDTDPDLPLRVILDEGHHIFDAADSIFSVHLTGQEGTDLRRWLRGKEASQRRARGLRSRLEDLISGDVEANSALDAVLEAARILPSKGWLSRVAGTQPLGPFEAFLQQVRAHIFRRAADDKGHTLEAPAHNIEENLADTAETLAKGLKSLEVPLRKLAMCLQQKLEEESDTLDTSSRGRLEAVTRSLGLRVELIIEWQNILASLTGTSSKEDIFDWLQLDRIERQEWDMGLHRHLIDPTSMLADTVYAKAHGVLVTSATLRDKAADPDDWQAADMRTGSQHLDVPPRRLSLASPFDYAKQSRILIVKDVNKNNPDQVAAAMKSLFLASQGSALGLFTAIARLKDTFARIEAPLRGAHIPLYAQHIDPMDTSTLVDIFKAEERACLLGTDAVRDGVDVPGESLKLLVFDRVPWPRPTLLHKARRTQFGGRVYDEMLVRLKLAQAFGRLIRRKTDHGVFVILDGQTPTRLLEGLPVDVVRQPVGLGEAVSIVGDFLGTNEKQA